MARKPTPNRPAPQKLLIPVVGQKGGVGKTAYSRSLLSHLRTDLGLQVHAYDGDGAVGGLIKVFGTKDADGSIADRQEPAVGCGFYDIRSEKERDVLLDSLDQGADIVLHDLAGGSLSSLTGIVDGGKNSLIQLCRAAEEMGYRTVFVHVISNIEESLRSVADYLHATAVGGTASASAEMVADHCIVMNGFFGDPEDFIWVHGHDFEAPNGTVTKRGGSIKQDICGPLGFPLIFFPRVPGGSFSLAEFQRVPLAQLPDAMKMRTAERMRLKGYLNAFADEVAPLRGYLGLNRLPMAAE